MDKENELGLLELTEEMKAAYKEKLKWIILRAISEFVDDVLVSQDKDRVDPEKWVIEFIEKHLSPSKDAK